MHTYTLHTHREREHTLTHNTYRQIHIHTYTHTPHIHTHHTHYTDTHGERVRDTMVRESLETCVCFNWGLLEMNSVLSVAVNRYPTTQQYNDVVNALLQAHPFLDEDGCGFVSDYVGPPSRSSQSI